MSKQYRRPPPPPAVVEFVAATANYVAPAIRFRCRDCRRELLFPSERAPLAVRCCALVIYGVPCGLDDQESENDPEDVA